MPGSDKEVNGGCIDVIQMLIHLLPNLGRETEETAAGSIIPAGESYI